MAPISSTDTLGGRFAPAQRRVLSRLASQSIEYGLDHGRPMPVMAGVYEADLGAPGAVFVTLKRGGQLRGCIGSLEPRRPLVEDVAHNAYAAAFEDPRFPPLRREEIEDLEIQLSVLSPAVPMRFDSEAELVAQLRPGIDGLVLIEGMRRGTFLPSVWEQLPDPWQFLDHLKQKAGLPSGYWSPTVRVERYTTESW